MFGAMRAEQQTYDPDEDTVRDVLHRTRAGFHRAVAAISLAGNDVVMDHVLSEPWRLADLLAVMAGIDVVFVGVNCPAAELVRREAARGDRVVGTAAAQIPYVHAHGIYDVEVDTGAESVQVCSTRIRDYLEQHPPPTARAFDQLRRSTNS